VTKYKIYSITNIRVYKCTICISITLKLCGCYNKSPAILDKQRPEFPANESIYPVVLKT
jgi:hypothetical protein